MTTTVNPPNLAKATVRGTFWTYAGYYGGKTMVFLSTLVLVRLLTKEDFGVMGYATTVLSFLDVLRDMGIGPALIYHKDNEDVPHTAFWLILGVGVVLSAVTFLVLGPLAGWYFNDPRAVWATSVLALIYPITALGTVHETLLNKSLDFQRRFIPDFTQAMSKGVLSILLALLGWGPWSLILGYLGAGALSSIVDWVIVKWRPRFRFSWTIARTLLNYGFHTVTVNAAAIFVLNIDYLLVGRFLGAEALGMYTVVFRIPELLILQFCTIIAKVIFPVYAKMRDVPGALSQGFLETLRYVPLVTVPMGLGLALVAEPFLFALFPNDWAPAIPVMRAIAIYSMMLSLSYNAGDVYKAEGRPAILTWLTLARLVVLAPALWYVIATYESIVYVGWVQAGVAFLGGILNLVIAGRMLHVTPRQIFAALAPSVVGGAVMSVAVWLTLSQLMLIEAPYWAQFLLSVLVGVGVYVGVVWWYQPALLRRGWQAVRGALPKKS